MNKHKIHYLSTFWFITKKSKIIYIFLLFLILYFIFSAAIYYYDKSSFSSYGDALWFTFVSIFTIGYGDYTVHTLMSRILTIILVIYGSIIIAIFTAIWVNLVSQVTKTVVFNEDQEMYDKLCNLDSLSSQEIKKIQTFFKNKIQSKPKK